MMTTSTISRTAESTEHVDTPTQAHTLCPTAGTCTPEKCVNLNDEDAQRLCSLC